MRRGWNETGMPALKVRLDAPLDGRAEDAEHIWILNGPCRIEYGARWPEDGLRFVDKGVEPAEAATAVEEMCAFIRANVRGRES